MAVDYDLIIIGGTPEGVFAALSAASFKARVALIKKPVTSNLGFKENLIYLLSLKKLLNSQLIQSPWEISNSILKEPIAKIPVKQWSDMAISIIEEQDDSRLVSMGVDVIQGVAEFYRKPKQGLRVNNRQLRSRSYLIATASYPSCPKIPGLDEVGYLTISHIWEKDKLKFLPDNLIIIGGNPLALEFARCLSMIGKNITLIVEDKRVLPYEDIEVSSLIQSQLEVDGVKIFTDSSVTQAKYITKKKWLQVDNIALETDEIIILGDEKPHLNGLNLEGVGVEFEKDRLIVNQKLQTTNPRIYACGAAIGGYNLANIAQYEAKIAVLNALFLPLFKTNYNSIPLAFFTKPTLARVGLTENQARKRYGDSVIILKQYFKHLANARVIDETTGFCKLVVLDNGEIIGGHIVGNQADELIGIIALAIGNKIKVGKLTDLSLPSLTFSEILTKFSQLWWQERISRNNFLANCLEDWFIWRRNSNR